jgi:glycosyltransferase involved in cell wall biosynthesis
VRVLYLSDFFWPYIGGPEILSAALLPEMACRGHEVLAVSSHGDRSLPDEEPWRGVSILRLPLRRAIESGQARLVGDTLRRFIAVAREFSPDVIHLGMVGPVMLFHLQSARMIRVPTLATVQTELRSLRPGTMAWRLLHAASWIRFVSSRLLEMTCGQIPELRKKASVLYSFFPSETTRVSPVPVGPPRLLYLGRLIEEKNLTLILEAVSKVRSAYPQVRLVIAGEGPERETLVRRTEDLGLCGLVDFLGQVEPTAVPALLNECTALVLSSTREGLPTAAIAAATMGRPIVATRVGSIDEVVVHESTGLLVDSSVGALSEGILGLLRDPKAAALMGARAQDRARILFDRQRCIDAFENLYEQIRAS